MRPFSNEVVSGLGNYTAEARRLFRGDHRAGAHAVDVPGPSPASAATRLILLWFTLAPCGFQAAESQTNSAVIALLRKAETGGALEWTAAGLACLRGSDGVAQDFGVARRWLQAAAEKGVAEAQESLGLMYERGLGVDVDLRLALGWYLKAANAGSLGAQHQVAVLCLDDKAAQPGQAAEGVKWLRRSAEAGFPLSQNLLGYLNQSGKWMPRNPVEALKWFRLAANAGVSEAQNNLGWLCQHGEGIPQNYAEALRWYRASADAGNSFAKNNLGNLYFAGLGVPRDYHEAFKWFKQAADAGNHFGQYNLALMYVEGKHVDASAAEAIVWYKKSAASGNGEACFRLGTIYYEGKLTPENKAEALAWFRRGAEYGFADAQSVLGHMLLEGDTVERDFAQGFAWVLKAAAAGNARACCTVGSIYAEGTNGVEKNEVEAESWFAKAAEMGDSAAKAYVEKRLARPGRDAVRGMLGAAGALNHVNLAKPGTPEWTMRQGLSTEQTILDAQQSIMRKVQRAPQGAGTREGHWSNPTKYDYDW